MVAKKSFIGNPYFRSNRQARIYPTQQGAENALKRKQVKGEIYKIGKYSGTIYVIKEKGKKYFSR